MRQNIVYFLTYILQELMKDEDDTQKLKIHQILNRHSFYRLPLIKYFQILRLIEMPEARQAKTIQENVFTGIMKLTEALTLPKNYSKLIAKRYFNPEIEKDISAQVKSYVTMIVDDYLAKMNSKEAQKVTVDSRKDSTLYPMMPFNTLTYPNPNDYGTNPKDSSNMQLQMYYLNMFNYGNHPQMNNEMKNNEQRVISEKEPEDKQVKMRYIEAQADPQVEIKAEYNGKMQDQHAGLIQAEISQQFSMNKSPQIEIGFFSPIINPQSQLHFNPNEIKLVSNEVQIQTDLSLLNEDIQVFPRENPSIQQTTIIRTHRGKIIDQMGNAKRKRKQKQKQQPQKKMQDHDPPQLGGNSEKKESKQYIITVRREYLYEDSPKEQHQTQELPSLNNKSSEFERLQRKMSLELSILKQGVNLQESLRNCPCKGTIKSQDIFQCLTCQRMFHSSCLKYQCSFDVQQCHICKLEMYETTTEVKECINIFYTTDILREKIDVEFAIAQYQYFLFRKIRHHEIELRCCKLKDSENVEMIWPDSVTISVNDKVAVQIQGANFRRRKDAIIVTQNIIQGNYESLDQTEKIKISFDFLPWSRDLIQAGNKSLYVIGIYFVEKIEFEAFIEKYSKNVESFSPDYITNLMDINNADVDDGLEIQKLVCNLWDPFTRNLIKTPVRGSACLHLQCFDLRNYLTFMYATKNRLWKCPVCNKDSKKLLLDQQFKQLIRKSVLSKTIPNEMTFMKDGSILLKILLNQDSGQETPPLVQQGKKKCGNPLKKIEKNPHLKKQEYIYKQ